MIELLTNLAAGAIGAVLGAFVAYRLQIREGKKLGKGAARAVYMEMAGNMTTARMGAAGNPELGAIREELYVAESARLATYLTPTELMAVAWAYSLVPVGATALATLRGGGGRKADDPERAILEQLVATITPATTLLNPRVWSAKERVALERGVPGWREKEMRPSRLNLLEWLFASRVDPEEFLELLSSHFRRAEGDQRGGVGRFPRPRMRRLAPIGCQPTTQDCPSARAEARSGRGCCSRRGRPHFSSSRSRYP